MSAPDTARPAAQKVAPYRTQLLSGAALAAVVLVVIRRRSAR